MSNNASFTPHSQSFAADDASFRANDASFTSTGASLTPRVALFARRRASWALRLASLSVVYPDSAPDERAPPSSRDSDGSAAQSLLTTTCFAWNSLLIETGLNRAGLA
jgi:hypothetical protein